MPAPDGQSETTTASTVDASTTSAARERDGVGLGDVTLPLKLQVEVTLPGAVRGELMAWRHTFERFASVMERWLECALTNPGLPAPPAMPWTMPSVRPPEQPAPRPAARVETQPPPSWETIPTPALPAAQPKPILPEEMPVLLLEESRPIQRQASTQAAKAVKSAPEKTIEVRSAPPPLRPVETTDGPDAAALERAAAHAQRGERHRAAGEKDKALECYREALALDADCARAYLGRASLYIEQGRLNEALVDCNSALRREPQRAVLYVLRGLVYTRLGNLKRALEEADDAIRFDPRLPSAYMLRGSTRFKKGMMGEALADIKEAIRLRPNDAKFYAELGRLLAHTGQYEQAARIYGKVLELSPNFHEARFLRGAALRLAGDVAGAEAELAEYLRRCPRSAAAHYQRGLCRLAQRNYAQAMTDFDKAIALKPDDQAARAAKEKTLNLWEGAAKDPKGSAATEAVVDLFVEERETDPPAVTTTARGEPAPQEADLAGTAKEQPLKTEKREGERAAQKARAAQRPARNQTRRDDGDEERPPWIRRLAVAAAVLALGYLLGPMLWSFVMGRSFSQDDKDAIVAEAKVSAAELWERYRSDATSAQSEFGEKVIEVRGIVQDVKHVHSGQKDDIQIVLLGDWRRGGRIVCALAPTKSVTQGTLLSRVDRFGTVALIGKCTGQEGKTVNLDDVRLVEVRSR